MPGLNDLDWIAIAASTFVAAALGAAWYSPARFGRASIDARGKQAHGLGRARRAMGGSVCSCLIAIAGLACSQQDIPGTYEVQLLVEGANAPIEATMILTTTYFEASRRGYDAMPDRDDSIGEPNSCLILPSIDPSDPTPRSVSVFETRIRGGEFVVPVTIFDTSEQRMEITELSFFAGAAGGTVAFYDEQAMREGRIIGTRIGGPDGMRCGAELAKFHAKIDQLLESS